MVCARFFFLANVLFRQSEVEMIGYAENIGVPNNSQVVPYDPPTVNEVYILCTLVCSHNLVEVFVRYVLAGSPDGLLIDIGIDGIVPFLLTRRTWRDVVVANSPLQIKNERLQNQYLCYMEDLGQKCLEQKPICIRGSLKFTIESMPIAVCDKLSKLINEESHISNFFLAALQYRNDPALLVSSIVSVVSRSTRIYAKNKVVTVSAFEITRVEFDAAESMCTAMNNSIIHFRKCLYAEKVNIRTMVLCLSNDLNLKLIDFARSASRQCEEVLKKHFQFHDNGTLKLKRYNKKCFVLLITFDSDLHDVSCTVVRQFLQKSGFYKEEYFTDSFVYSDMIYELELN
jgi:hypothetical protein